jgi:hypothetical protein
MLPPSPLPGFVQLLMTRRVLRWRSLAVAPSHLAGLAGQQREIELCCDGNFERDDDGQSFGASVCGSAGASAIPFLARPLWAVDVVDHQGG